MKSFDVSGCFHNDGYLLDTYVFSVKTENKSEAIELARNAECGKIYFEAKTGHVVHELEGLKTVLNDKKDVKCQILSPRENHKHETLVGAPIYTDEDYKDILFNELLEALSNEAVERDKERVSFECLAFGVNPSLISVKEMLATTEIGDRWVNENGVAIEHTNEGIKWENTNRPFPSEVTKEILSSELLSMKWIWQIGPNKDTLVYFCYAWDEIKSWTEDECKKEIIKHKYWEQLDMNSWEEFEKGMTIK
ncbi:hypothetical protein [Bacillus pseudomycoides]|uniref:hypothetical protein n=1 Tax=Bacillus pseudomycoides TaxID=64104 RepID=UPI000BEC9970|nr:hypothetical protein [Bacillus pseudomycoides]PEB42226.1 hypothetical protein COO06_07900 [Bacillus pseudomycoides]PEM69343.1 hypothetical protein CN619_21660 [Bacillus pseudomycoides]PGA62185.1 hypothetical protein COL84_13495 [Bacillus pseudomycoides]